MTRRIHGDEDARGARIDFAVNVIDDRPPAFILDALTARLGDLAAYPDAREQAEVEALIASHHGVPSSSVMLVAGAAEGFALLPSLGLSTPTVIHPGFSEPEVIFDERGLDVRRQVLAPPFNRLRPLDRDSDAVVIGNPTNPTGVVWDPRELREWAGARWLVIDEAFLDMAGDEPAHTAMPQVAAGDERLVVLRSLTKTWSIAGLRVGYVVAAPGVIATLRKGRSHWPMGTLQLHAARAVFTRGLSALPGIVAEVGARRERMRELLFAAGFEEASASRAPYLLVRPHFRGADAETIRRGLLERGIAVRRCDTFPGLGTDYWRLAVRSEAEVVELLRAIGELV